MKFKPLFNALLILLLALTIITPAVQAAVPAPLMVADIASGATGSSPGYMTVYNGALYFAADGNDGHQRELWKYDPSTGAAGLVADINPGTGTSNPAYLTVYNGMLYFSADGGDGNGIELWKYDPINGAALAADIYPGLNHEARPSFLTVYNNMLYFSAVNPIYGMELMEYDPINGASLAADINPGINSSFIQSMTAYNGKLYMSAEDGTATGAELWQYDPINGASLAADIAAGDYNSSYPGSLAVYNNLLYFRADDQTGTNGSELWQYDPINGAALAADIVSGSGGSDPDYLTVYNNLLYFQADNGINGVELLKYNGASASLAEDIVPGVDGSYPSDLAVFNGVLYFQADNVTNGAELWKYDAIAPTVTANSLQSSYAGTGPGSFTVTFSEEVNNPAGNTDANDVTNPANYLLVEKGVNKTPDTLSCLGGVQSDDTAVTGASVSYANPTATVTLSTTLPTGNYRLFVCGTTSIIDIAGNPLSSGVDYTSDFTVDTVAPTVSTNSLQSSYAGTGPGSFTVTFSEEVNNPAGNTDAKDVTNPANYLLVEKGANKTTDTLSCLGGVQSDDTAVTGASVSYANPTATVTLSTTLPTGNYRLFVCGTTSIIDIAGNPLNSGVDYTSDFTVDTIAPTVSANSLQASFAGTGPSTFTVTFSEDVNNPAGNSDAKDVSNPANYMLIEKGTNKTSDTISCLGGVQTDDTRITVASVSYANPTATVTLSEPLPTGDYRLFVCGTTSIIDIAGNPLNNGLDYTSDFTVDSLAPTVSANSLQASYTGTGPGSFTITFSEEVNNPAGNSDAKDVTNPNNYLLVEKGANNTTDTLSCLSGVQTDDTQITGASVSYTNPTATVTLSAPLPVGNYRLFVCGSTSIVDVADNPLNNGVDYTYDFTVETSGENGYTLYFPIFQRNQ